MRMGIEIYLDWRQTTTEWAEHDFDLSNSTPLQRKCWNRLFRSSNQRIRKRYTKRNVCFSDCLLSRKSRWLTTNASLGMHLSSQSRAGQLKRLQLTQSLDIFMVIFRRYSIGLQFTFQWAQFQECNQQIATFIRRSEARVFRFRL